MDIQVTPRGFKIASFKDLNQQDCSLQESSLATDDAIWLGVDDARMHINQELAEELIIHLQKFIDDGVL
jgi:hypothetical protein